MSTPFHGSIAALGYRKCPDVDFSAIVDDIDRILQNTDVHPRQVSWHDNSIAYIDRDGVRIGLGWLPGQGSGALSYLVLAIGPLPVGEAALGSVSCIHLADRLVMRIKDDLPFDTVMRGETPEAVDTTLISTIFELLQTDPGLAAQDTRDHSEASDAEQTGRSTRTDGGHFDVIDPHEVTQSTSSLARWMDKRALPTAPLRLTVHTLGLSVMLYTPPLGAFMLTYSLLRDMGARS